MVRNLEPKDFSETEPGFLTPEMDSGCWFELIRFGLIFNAAIDNKNGQFLLMNRIKFLNI